MEQERNRPDGGNPLSCPSRKKLHLPNQLDLYMEDHVRSFFAEEKQIGKVLDAVRPLL